MMKSRTDEEDFWHSTKCKPFIFDDDDDGFSKVRTWALYKEATLTNHELESDGSTLILKLSWNNSKNPAIYPKLLLNWSMADLSDLWRSLLDPCQVPGYLQRRSSGSSTP